jgi:hypothetical protein
MIYDTKEEWVRGVQNILGNHLPCVLISDIVLNYFELSQGDLRKNHELFPKDSLCEAHFQSYKKIWKLNNFARAKRIASHCGKLRLCKINPTASIFSVSCISPPNNWRRTNDCECGNTASDVPKVFRNYRHRLIYYCPGHTVAKDCRCTPPPKMD